MEIVSLPTEYPAVAVDRRRSTSPGSLPSYSEFCLAVAGRLNLDIAKMHSEAFWVDDLGATSVDIVKVVMLIRQRYGVKLSTSEAGRLRTVGDAYRLLVKPLDRTT